MLPYFLQPLNSKLLEDKLEEIVLQLIPVGWKHMMTCANFKPLKHSMEELVEYLKGVKCSITKNPPERHNQNNSSSGLKKTKKGKCKCDTDKKSQDITNNSTSYKRAADHASSARCLVAMLNYIPLTNAITRICCLVFLMDTRRSTWTWPGRK
eukprot:9469664-Ditylum_brightwellii.AAC.1